MSISLVVIAMAMVAGFFSGPSDWWLDVTRLKIARRLVAGGAPLVDVDAPDIFGRAQLIHTINVSMGTARYEVP